MVKRKVHKLKLSGIQLSILPDYLVLYEHLLRHSIQMNARQMSAVALPTAPIHTPRPDPALVEANSDILACFMEGENEPFGRGRHFN